MANNGTTASFSVIARCSGLVSCFIQKGIRTGSQLLTRPTLWVHFSSLQSLGVSIFLLQFEVFIGIFHDSEIPLEVFPLYHYRASAVVGMKG